MAIRRKPLIVGWMIPGGIVAFLLIPSALLALVALWLHAPETENWHTLVNDRYLWHLLGFSFWQALLSTLLSVIPAIPLARALNRRRFPLRHTLLRFCSMTLVMPVLVTIFGLLSVYGREGWLARICQHIGLDYTFSPYGLQGILLAHLFFNLPLAARLLLQALENIPAEQRQLAAQLGMQGWYRFSLLEWPALCQQIAPTAALIFMLCFASFATVLALGGGPQATTIELAIFQALSYDYDPGRAALLALLQLLCCLALIMVTRFFTHPLPAGAAIRSDWRNPEDSLRAKCTDTLIILLALLLIIPPLLAVVVDGLQPGLQSVIQQPALWQASGTSLCIALKAGLLSVVLCTMLLWSSRELRLRHYPLCAQMLELSGMMILAMPAIVLATGYFLLFYSTVGLPDSAEMIVVYINALMAIPYAMKILERPLRDIAERYNWLCLSLNIRGINRFRMIELKALKRPLAQAFAFACVLSIGDFGVVALFGSTDFRTLPFYLYQQIGSYHSQQGAVTALLLLLICFMIFTLIDILPGRHAETR